MNWLEVCHDRGLANLPYKIELDKYGKIVMNPSGKKHSKLQSRIQRLLVELMPEGDPLPECAVETVEGTKVPDVAWMSDTRWASMDPDEVSRSARVLDVRCIWPNLFLSAKRPGSKLSALPKIP